MMIKGRFNYIGLHCKRDYAGGDLHFCNLPSPFLELHYRSEHLLRIAVSVKSLQSVHWLLEGSNFPQARQILCRMGGGWGTWNR